MAWTKYFYKSAFDESNDDDDEELFLGMVD